MTLKTGPLLVIFLTLSACVPGQFAPVASGTPAGIPEVMQGRWGLNENDCDPSRDDNKGLMAVEATTLAFYESRATLTNLRSATADTVTADYAFTGEGQTWSRTITFQTAESGMVLLRSDEGEGAFDGTYRYLSCEAV